MEEEQTPLMVYPDAWTSYLYLAQLTDDDPHTAIAHYQAAIDILQTQLKGKSISSGNTEDDNDSEIKSNIIRAYLGMVEIWMDPEHDLWQVYFLRELWLGLTIPCIYSVDPAASSTCDTLLSQALQIDPTNLEALQTLASVRLSQEKPDEALLALRTFPQPPFQDDAATDPQAHALHLLSALPIQTRITRAKLLLECGAHADALSLLEGVLATDDANVEGWYLMGWAWWLLAERRKEGDPTVAIGLGEEGEQLEWQDMARDARDCLETCQMLHASQGHPDAPLLEHVEELIGTLDSLGIQPSPAEEDGGDAEGWEDASANDEDEDIEMA
ncbi:hypothetical protein PAXINDRAFT_12828 [Paxillus involutus ATCC 200175]|uniref:Uncharacterized protein n=1 Tax=Paxillus involutus ATCC 200175 TaxID=664439 RepID=A0A0C9TFP2_PAXIN|nr:hypothetical protein PAXINDRAFT_12828 [Paxillus involutus ATCC 200175]